MTEIDVSRLTAVTGGGAFLRGALKYGAVVAGPVLAAAGLNKLQGGKNCLGVVPMDSQAGYALCKPPTAPANNQE